MSDQTISKLPNYDSKGENVQQDDIFPFSHSETIDQTDYVTYKVSLATLEKTISADIYDAQREALSNDLDLKELAWVDKINDDNVDSDGLNFKRSINRDTYGGLALSDESHLNLHDLAHKDEASLKLSALAHKSIIDLASHENLEGLLPLDRIDSKVGDLLSTDREDLDLHTLAHKDQVNLGAYGAAGGVFGRLDFEKGITNYTPYVLPLAQRSEDIEKIGGINLGFYEGYQNINKNYALQVNDKGQAYVHVPWVNTNTTSSYVFENGINGFTVIDQDNNSQFVKVSPNILSNIIGQGSPGCFAIFDSEHTLRSGLCLGDDKKAFLRNDGTWAYIPIAAQSTDGLMSKDDKKVLDNLHNYSLPLANSSSLGGIKIGAETKGRLYALKLDSNGRAYVEVPWVNTDTTYSAGTGLKLTGTTFSLEKTEADQKHSSTAITEVMGTVTMESGATWNSPGNCIVTVWAYLKVNISSCGHPYPRYIRFKSAGQSRFSDIVTMRTKRVYTTTLICKKNDQIQITGYCGNNHGTEYHITGTYLS